MIKEGYTVAIIGATGLVGREMVTLLADSTIPVGDLRLFASERSAGECLDFGEKSYIVRKLERKLLKEVDIALFAAGGSVSRSFCPIAAGYGAIVIDNSKEFRMDPRSPLIIPEINGHRIPTGPGIIANPNCSTIQMLVALGPLHRVARIKRIVVATYQSVSGKGKRGIDELFQQVRDIFRCVNIEKSVFAHQIAFNIIPSIDVYHEDGSCNEEIKMMRETCKILEDETIGVAATTVRVPTFVGHGEAVNVEFHQEMTAEKARDLLCGAPGITFIESDAGQNYPTPIDVAGKNDVFVSRLRNDPSAPHALNMWIMADNVRKGAALNAIQIAELWCSRKTEAIQNG